VHPNSVSVEVRRHESTSTSGGGSSQITPTPPQSSQPTPTSTSRTVGEHCDPPTAHPQGVWRSRLECAHVGGVVDSARDPTPRKSIWHLFSVDHSHDDQLVVCCRGGSSTSTTTAPVVELARTTNVACVGGVGIPSEAHEFPLPAVWPAGQYDVHGSCMASFNPTRLAQAAMAVQYAYCTRHPRVAYSQPQRGFGEVPIPAHSDCSSFVQTILEKAGYGCLFGREKATTSAMRDVIRLRGGRYHQTPRVGDVMMWASGESGHVAIVVEVCPHDKYKIAAMESKGPSLIGCLSVSKLARYGLGGASGLQGFWTPH